MLRISLLIAAVVLLVASGKPLPSLDESTIVYLPEPGCSEYEPTPGTRVMPSYTMQADLGQGWVSLTNLAKKGLAPGHCASFALLEEPPFRACCKDGDAIACSDAATHSAEHPTCQRIFDLMSGREYPADQVAGWNAAHTPLPTPTPQPPAPTPVPTSPPTPTMLPYLGACCFDLAKPWVCGVSTEPVCRAQGGVRWLRQTKCSNAVCSGG